MSNLSLSQWDLDNLSPEHQEQIKNYQNIWQTDPSQRENAHNASEQIRKKYGYSGGMDGAQYDPFGTPAIPQIPQYESKYDDELKNIFEQIKNPPKYESPYADLINQSISDLKNRPSHSYDPDNDPAYQAFLQRATRAGDKAYADNLGGLSAMTGGRANSWAGTVASQARNQYVLQAQEAVIQFEERSYNRYQNETTNMYNFVNLLQAQDQSSYNRYRDSIGDTKELANIVMELDRMDFDKYKEMSNESWKVFEAESQQYKDALQEKKDKIAEALDRTNLTGFVNNQDAITLGVPTGTLSQAARERAEAMADYVTKQQHDLNQFAKEKEISHKFDLELLSARERIDINADNRREQMTIRSENREVGRSSGGVYGGLGSVAAKYESSGNPGTVSTGKGDHGGVSYGIYQFSSQTGGANSFLEFLKTNNPGYYQELSKSGKPGSAGFSAKWKEIAARDTGGFAELQHRAIQEKYYEPAVANVKKATGIDVNARTPALQEAIWSTAVQHGSGAVAKIVQRALSNSPNGKNDDAALISAIYDERGSGNGSKYFPSSSKAVQQSVANRFKQEKQDVLAILNNGGGSADIANVKKTKADITTINTGVKEFNTLVSGAGFKKMSTQQKETAIRAFEDKVVNNVNKGLYGINSLAIGKEIIYQMQQDPAYKPFQPKDPAQEIKKQEVIGSMNNIKKPGFSLNDTLIRNQ